MDITVVGEGAVLAAPDVLRLFAGVEARRPSAAEAYTATRAAAARLAAALREEGVADEDVRTVELSLGPEYEAYPKVSAYRASQGVEVVARDLARADRLIDTVAGVGEEARLNGLAFELSDPAAALREARARAFRDAAAKAAQYAELAGRPLGRVVSVSEDVRGAPQPMRLAADLAETKAASLSPGRQSLAVTVQVGYDFA
ncbi:SIMPL domain-containing protein [Actinomadura sp. ATCC 31491]|uniref:SIMPL domain-containing protein n=1 Tax=Actinomadura luzonensis TaxID=2805427 RepID=A0ABT0G7S6_9ACTN|nr:SIMPL domain-containing protein [Actinomadura luzonensis]MCK2220640.1 SIMPL domain-containing protein [Actinomadura luzonensis]